MSHEPRYACPKCKSTSRIEISIMVSALLIQERDGNVQTDPDQARDGSHEWSDSSPAHCQECSHHARLGDFRRAA